VKNGRPFSFFGVVTLIRLLERDGPGKWRYIWAQEFSPAILGEESWDDAGERLREASPGCYADQ
jgi:hypothetical protein